MLSLLGLTPSHWHRRRRVGVSISAAVALMALMLLLLPHLLALAPEPIGPAAAQFASGAVVTLYLTVVAGGVGLAVGLALALAKMSRLRVLRTVAEAYIWVIRGTPLLVQILFVFLALPLLLPIQLSDVNSAIVALAVNVGAYNAEAMRSGIQAIARGQKLAALSLGMSQSMSFRYIVFPQAFKISLPPLVNNLVALLKDSSLAYVIGVVELSNIGNRVQASSFQPVPVFITVACVYLLLTTLMTQITEAVEYGFDSQSSVEN